MAKRSKKMEVVDGNGQSLGTVEIPADAPSVEERLKLLEAALVDCRSLITSQALKLDVAEENARQLKKSREKVSKLEAAMDAAKRSAASAKKAYEAAVEDHFALEESLTSGQQQLPFPKDETTPAEDLAWRAVVLDTLEIAKPIVSKLFEANICTVGDLSDFTRPSPTGFAKKLADIDGIGPVAAEAIEDALARFWESRAASEPLDLDMDDMVAEAVRGRESELGDPFEDDSFSGDAESEDLDA